MQDTSKIQSVLEFKIPTKNAKRTVWQRSSKALFLFIYYFFPSPPFKLYYIRKQASVDYPYRVLETLRLDKWIFPWALINKLLREAGSFFSKVFTVPGTCPALRPTIIVAGRGRGGLPPLLPDVIGALCCRVEEKRRINLRESPNFPR